MRFPSPQVRRDDHRSLVARHEAGHAIAALASDWYLGLFVELDPEELPDLAGVHTAVRRHHDPESPWKRLTIGVGGFIVAAAGWLSEGASAAASPYWADFYERYSQGDAAAATERIHECAAALGCRSPTAVMWTEAQRAAEQTIRHPSVRPSVEHLAADLLRTGRVERLERYWPHERLGIVESLAARWSRRFARHSRAAAALVASAREQRG